MRSNRFTMFLGIICVGVIFLLSPLMTDIALSAGHTYPDKPITIVVGWKAGGGTDTWVRATAKLMEKKLGVPIIVVNKPGAGSTAQLEEVMTKKKADGYTISAVEAGTAVNRTRGKMVCPDLRTEVAFLGSMSGQDYCFGARVDSNIKSLKEFVDMCKAKPGEIKVAHTGTVGSQYSILMMFKKEAKIDFEMLPLGNTATLMKELLAGRVQIAQVEYSAWAPYVKPDVPKSMQLRTLAVAADKKLSHIKPDTPTFRDYGYDVVFKMFQGFAVRPDTPEDIIEKLRSTFKAVATDPEYRKVLFKIGRGAMEYETPEKTQALTCRLVDMATEQMATEAASMKSKK